MFLRISQISPNAASNIQINPKERSNKKVLPNSADFDPSSQETELSGKRLVFLELFENDKLLYQVQGLNAAILSEICLQSTKDESLNRNYYLQARFELRDWEACIQNTEETKNIIWIAKVFTSEPLAFVRDTQKEDYERNIRKGWEDKEPGRSEKAKKSRQKYLLLLKKEQGVALTEQENELLNESRLSKKQREEEAAAKQTNIKGKSPMKQDKKPPAKVPGKKEDPLAAASLEEKKERPLPLSTAHNMLEIKDFLSLLESERSLEERPLHSGLIEVRSLENKNELKEGFQMGKEEYLSSMKLSNETKDQLKNLQTEWKKTFLTSLDNRRKEFFEQISLIVKERDEIKKILNYKRDKEKALVDFIGIEKGVNEEELDKLLKEMEGKEGEFFNKELMNLGKKALNNAKINSISEKLNTAVGIFDLEKIQMYIDEIGKNNIIIDEEIMEKALEIVEEAKNNPNYITEKQAELKKTAKKPAGNVKK